jgi:hypothetical protein
VKTVGYHGHKLAFGAGRVAVRISSVMGSFLLAHPKSGLSVVLLNLLLSFMVSFVQVVSVIFCLAVAAVFFLSVSAKRSAKFFGALSVGGLLFRPNIAFNPDAFGAG